LKERIQKEMDESKKTERMEEEKKKEMSKRGKEMTKDRRDEKKALIPQNIGFPRRETSRKGLRG